MDSKTNSSPENWLTDYGDILYRYALLRVRSESIAEDLVQETLLAAMQAYEKYAGKSTLRTWLIGILKHKIIDHFRKHKHEISPLNREESNDDILAYQFDQQGNWQVNLVDWKTPDSDINNQQFMSVFNDCLSRLPERMASLLLLRTIDNVATKDCCEILGLNSENQLWVSLSRTRVKLRQCLETNWFSKE